MGFAEQLCDDLDGVFFDEDVFASRHTVDGKELLVVVDDEGMAETRRTKQDDKWRDDVHKNSLLFYVRESDMERKLAVNSEIDFDGKMYYVNDIRKSDGVWKILLGRNQV